MRFITAIEKMDPVLSFSEASSEPLVIKSPSPQESENKSIEDNSSSYSPIVMENIRDYSENKKIINLQKSQQKYSNPGVETTNNQENQNFAECHRLSENILDEHLNRNFKNELNFGENLNEKNTLQFTNNHNLNSLNEEENSILLAPLIQETIMNNNNFEENTFLLSDDSKFSIKFGDNEQKHNQKQEKENYNTFHHNLNPLEIPGVSPIIGSQSSKESHQSDANRTEECKEIVSILKSNSKSDIKSSAKKKSVFMLTDYENLKTNLKFEEPTSKQELIDIKSLDNNIERNASIGSASKSKNSYDEIQIGGSKKNSSNFNDNFESNTPSKNPYDEIPIGGSTRNSNKFTEENNIQKNSYDEIPIGGSKSNLNPFTEENMFPPQSKNIYDEMPIGGKANSNMFSEENMYPPEGAPTEKVKKPLKKATTFLKRKTAANVDIQKEENENPRIIEENNDCIINKPTHDIKNDIEANLEDRPTLINFEDVPIKQINSNANNFDEKPLGKTGYKLDALDEFPPEHNSFEVVNKNSDEPLSNRLKSKIWKVRCQALEELAKDPQSDFVSNFATFFADSNVNCVEKALVAYKAYLEANLIGFEQEILRIIVDKVYANGKTSIRIISVDILCMLFETLSDKGSYFEAVNQLLSHKNPKTVCSAINLLSELLINFGPQNLNFLKPFLNEIERIASGSITTTRNEAMNLYKEFYKWVGDAVLKTMTSKLKKSQQDELDKFISENPFQPVQPKRVKESASSKNTKGANNNAPTPIDPYDISTAVELFPKFGESFCEKVLSASKWTEKKEFLEEMLKFINVPKLSAKDSSDLSTLFSTLKKLLNDNNTVVVQLTVQLIGVLAKGLRKTFSSCKYLFPVLLEKFKDKRTGLVEEIKKTLENFSYCINFEDILENLKETLGDKSPPSIKINALGFIDKTLEKKCAEKTINKMKISINELMPVLKKLSDDGNGDLRDASLTSLGKIVGCFGDSILGDFQNQLNNAKMQKIQEAAAKMPVQKSKEESKSDLPEKEKDKEKEKPKLNQQPNQLNQVPTTSSTPSQVKPPKPLIKSATTKQIIAKPGQTVNKVASSKNLPEKEDLTMISPEEAIESIKKVLDEECLNKIGSNVPKVRLEAVQSLTNRIEELCDNQLLEELFIILKSKLKDWKDSNLNINKEILNLLQIISSKRPPVFTKRVFCVSSGYFLEKISENKKFTEACTEILTQIISCVSPKFVFTQLLTPQDTRKVTPKNQQEILLFAQKSLSLLPLPHIPTKLFLDSAKSALSQPTLKSSASLLLKSLYMYSGKEILKFLSDLPPPTFKSMTTELENVQILKENEKITKFEFSGEYASELETGGEKVENSLDSVPRADISAEVNKLLKKLNDPDWKVRREGIDNLEVLLVGNNSRVSINGLGELISTLKARLIEKNKNLSKGFIVFTGHLAESVGKDMKIHAKTLLLPLIGNLSDKQGFIRTDTLASMDRFAETVGAETVINTAAPFLSQESPEMRLELLNWILKYSDSLNKVDLKPFSNVILSCLLDRSKEIRASAEIFFEKIISIIGVNEFRNKILDLKPAAIQQLKPILTKYELDKPQEAPQANKKGEKEGTKDKKKITQIQIIKKETLSAKNSEKSFKIFNGGEKNELADQARNQLQFTQALETEPSFNSGELEQVQPPNKQVFELDCMICVDAKNFKIRRISQELSNPWPSDELIEDLVSQFVIDMKEVIVDELHKKLFSLDFRKHLEACENLKKACKLEPKNICEISDLIVKWGFIRTWGNSNTQIVTQIFSLFYCLLSVLDQFSCSLYDFEANLLLGCCKEVYSQISSASFLLEVIEIMGRVYYPEKIMNFFFYNLSNKSTGSYKSNLLELILKLFQKVPQNVLPILAMMPEYKDSLNLLTLLQQHHSNEILMIAGFKVDLQQSMNFSDISSIMKSSEGDVSVRKLDASGFKCSESQSKYKQLREKTHELREKVQVHESQSEKSLESSNKSGISNISEPKQTKIANITEDSFYQALKSLRTGNITQKIEMLLMINDVTINLNEKEDMKKILLNNSENLGFTLLETLKESFEKRKSTPNQFIQYFLNMVHKLFSLKTFVGSLKIGILASFTEEMIERLLSEDENKNSSSNNTYDFIKLLNSIMLRMLENSNINDMFGVLLDLLIKYRRAGVYSKILGLNIKCILKLTKSIETLAKELNSEMILLKFHEYLYTFGDEPLKSDDVGVKAFRTILNEMVKVYGERIWASYDVVKNHSVPDKSIYSWIQILLNQDYHQSALPSPKIDPSQKLSGKFQRSISTFQQNRSESEDKNDLLKMYVENLKNNQNFDESLIKIAEIIEKQPGLNLTSYFTGSSTAFIDYVLKNVERINERKRLGIQQDISYQRNEVKSEGYLNNSELEYSNYGNKVLNSSNINADLDNFQTKINQIKMKYGNIIKSNSQTQEEKELQKEKSSCKTPESLMQKINEMKSKIQFKGANLE